MPKRIFQRTCAVTVKLILHRLDDFRARVNGLGKLSIHILHVQMKANRRTTTVIVDCGTHLFHKNRLA